MRTNSILRNTIIGISAFISSNNVTPIYRNFNADSIYTINTTAQKSLKTINQTDSLALRGLTIMVNPGHGETLSLDKTASGAVASLNGKKIYEKDLNDSISKYQIQELEKLGATVIKIDNTRVPDILVEKLTQKPDLFISNHCDAQSLVSKRKAKRIFSGETIYTLNQKGKKIAGFINTELKSDESIPNNGVRANVDFLVLLRKLKAKNLKGHKIVYQNINNELGKEQAEIPSLLIEHGYMTCNNNLKILTTSEYQRKSAKLIVDGIVKYI